MPNPPGKSLRIWCNLSLPTDMIGQFSKILQGHELLMSNTPATAVWASASTEDPLLATADVALGQPSPQQAINTPSLKWVHLSSAGYTAWDTPEIRRAVADRDLVVTNSSHVFDEPCAQHILAYMLSLARQIPQAAVQQKTQPHWDSPTFRSRCRVLSGQTVLIFGYGAIAQRLVELLAPMQMDIIGVKRNPPSQKGVKIVNLPEADGLLKFADYVINILPDNADSAGYFNADRLASIKRGGCFINIGRGKTVDHDALLALLQSGHLGNACLDVTDPEPLPDDHPLWSAPNCLITPHIAGGFSAEKDRLISHFLENLDRYLAGEKLMDRILLPA